MTVEIKLDLYLDLLRLALPLALPGGERVAYVRRKGKESGLHSK